MILEPMKKRKNKYFNIKKTRNKIKKMKKEIRGKV